MNLVYLYLIKRAPEKAILQLKEVLAFDPENPEATETTGAFFAGRVHSSKGRGALCPRLLLVILGDVYLAKNDLSKAEEYFWWHSKGGLDNAGALFGLAQLSRMKGGKEASIYLIASLRSPLIRSRGVSLPVWVEAMRVEMFDEAKPALQRAVELRPKDPHICWLWESRGYAKPISSKLKNCSGACFKSNREMHRASYTLATCCSMKRNLTKLDCGWRRACERASIPRKSFTISASWPRSRTTPRARRRFRKSGAKLPTYVHARVALGSSYMTQRLYARDGSWRQPLSSIPMPTAHYNLALLYARTKEPAKAQEQMRIVETLKTGRRSTRTVHCHPAQRPISTTKIICAFCVICGLLVALSYAQSDTSSLNGDPTPRRAASASSATKHVSIVPREAAQLNTPMAQAFGSGS